MKQQRIIKEQTTIYNELSKQTENIIIYELNKMIFIHKEEKNIDYKLLKLEKDYRSKHNDYKLRFNIKKATKMNWFKNDKPNAIMTIEEFKHNAKIAKLNLGEYAEKIICEQYGIEYTRNNVPFYKDGDVNIGERRIQVKFQNATLCSLKTLNKLVNSNI